MKNDYETGLQRGRGSRHVVGRVRWVLLALVVVNIFLLYKLWDQKVELTSLKTKNDDIREVVSDINIKKAKAEKISSEIQLEKNECDRKLTEEKGLYAKYQNEKETCDRDLDSTGSKLKELTENFDKVTNEKEAVNAEHERCVAELAATKELVEKLQADLRAAKQTARHEESAKDENGNKPVLNDIVTAHEADNMDEIPGKEGEEIHDADATELVTLMQCQFNENADTQLCDYRDDLSSTGRWKIGHSDVINSHLEEDHDQNDVLYLFIDETILAENIPAGIIFQPFEARQCIKVEMTIFFVESGTIKIEDNEEVFELPNAEEEAGKLGWKKITFRFKKAASHAIKITGKMTSKGAFAIADILIIEEECKEDEEKREISENEEEDRITEEERKDISEIVK